MLYVKAVNETDELIVQLDIDEANNEHVACEIVFAEAVEDADTATEIQLATLRERVDILPPKYRSKLHDFLNTAAQGEMAFIVSGHLSWYARAWSYLFK